MRSCLLSSYGKNERKIGEFKQELSQDQPIARTAFVPFCGCEGGLITSTSRPDLLDIGSHFISCFHIPEGVSNRRMEAQVERRNYLCKTV
jgi:hypothetical protein